MLVNEEASQFEVNRQGLDARGWVGKRGGGMRRTVKMAGERGRKGERGKERKG